MLALTEEGTRLVTEGKSLRRGSATATFYLDAPTEKLGALVGSSTLKST